MHAWLKGCRDSVLPTTPRPLPHDVPLLCLFFPDLAPAAPMFTSPATLSSFVLPKLQGRIRGLPLT